MRAVSWKFLSLIIVMVLALGLGARILTPGRANAADPIQQWDALYTASSSISIPKAMGVDGSGNVYVTGYSSNGSDNDYTTIKYDASGVQQWARTTDWTFGDDVANAIAVDSSSNAYVTGTSWNGSDYDYETIKYYTDGTIAWAVRYTGGFTDMAKAIALDSSGNVYVTGDSYNGSLFELTTVKYDNEGNFKWVNRYSNGSNAGATIIAVDGSGNIYAFGNSGPISDRDYLTIKYSGDGIRQWVKIYDGPGDGTDEANAMALDGSGNVYVTGASHNGAGYDYATVKYSTGGDQLWVMRYGVAGNQQERATAIAVDGSGNAYVTGAIYNGTNFDYATVKYSTAGAQLWAVTYNGPANSNDMARAIAVDNSGDAYVTGQIFNGTNFNFATVKYSTAGAQQWVIRYNGRTGDNSDAAPLAIALHRNSIYVTGYMFDVTRFYFANVKYKEQPAITAVSPANGTQRKTLPVIITGTNLSGSTAVSFGDGITVNNFTVNSSTKITANIVISPTAKIGTRNVVVTTPSGFINKADAFKVLDQESTSTPIGSGSMTAPTQTATVNNPQSIPTAAIANIVVKHASLSTTSVSPNTPVTVTADISNRGTGNGSKKVTVYVNGEIETTQGVNVDSGGSSQLTFNVSRSEPGEYSVYVDGTPAGSFKVEAVTASDTILIVSIAFLAIAFVCGLIILRRRQNAGR